MRMNKTRPADAGKDNYERKNFHRIFSLLLSLYMSLLNHAVSGESLNFIGG